MSLEKLVNFPFKKNIKTPEEITETLKRVCRKSYCIRPTLTNFVSFILLSILANIKVLSNSLDEVNKAIVKEFTSFSIHLVQSRV